MRRTEDPNSPDLWFDDVEMGQRFTTSKRIVTEADIYGFAAEYDPQDFHLDPDFARQTEFGGLIASGLHIMCLSFKLFFDLNSWPNAVIASPGMEKIQFLKPVYPGDTLHVVADVISMRRSRSKPDRGLVVLRHTTINQGGEKVQSIDCVHMLRVRPAKK